MHLNSTARFTLIGTLNMWRNSFYGAFIAYNDANIDLRNEFQLLFTSNTQFSSTLATIYTMYEFKSYVIFTPLLKIFFLLIHMHVHLNSSRDPSCQAQIKNSQKKYHHTSYRPKNSKKKIFKMHYWYYGTAELWGVQCIIHVDYEDDIDSNKL